MLKQILTATIAPILFQTASAQAGKYALPTASLGITCEEGATLKEAKEAFNSQFVGENANAVVIKGFIDKSQVLAKRLSDLVVTTINGKVVICAVVSAK